VRVEASMNRIIPLVTVLMAAGCIEQGFSDKETPEDEVVPNILVDPPALQFDALTDGETQVLEFTVNNIGDAVLNVEDIVIGSGTAFTILGPEFEFELEPGADQVVEVEFTPKGADENFGAAMVLSDDPDGDDSTVDLLGYGLVPDLQISPESHSFGDAFVPCGASKELELKNIGQVDLEIYDLSYESGGMLQLRSDLDLPLVLAPGEATTVWVDFLPGTSGSDTGMLTVQSNDPGGDETADQNGEGAYLAEGTDTFTTPGAPPVDVLITIDQSCSMEQDNTDDVENGFPAFVQELQSISDWQLMLVTDPYTACATGGIMDGNTANAANLLVQNAFNIDHNDNDDPGHGFGWVGTTEKLLQLSASALANTGPGGCNEGFLRPGALLHIINLSDEPEQSNQSAQHWVDEFRSYVASDALVKVSGVLDLGNCGTGSAKYTDAVNITGGATLNICNANWGANFTDIASEVLEGLQAYDLSDPAVEDTIVVTVNGTETTDFTYEPNSGTVNVNSPTVGDGDEVVVDYQVADECN